ncbi:hypothetical protein BJV77DRAFT_1157924 [Russula vinacea]|nr:hypothetical protein BJV77DRAFT_1157924 [Russula vinacea]
MSRQASRQTMSFLVLRASFAICEDRERIEHAANSLQPPAPVEAHEPALLFMGSPAPPTAHVQPRQQVASTEVEDENDDGEDEGDCGAKDKRLPDGLASPPIPPSLDSSSNYATSPGLAHPTRPRGIPTYSGCLTSVHHYATWCRLSARGQQATAQNVPRLDAG